MQGNWFWNSKAMDVVEKGLLNLTHWVWAKRNSSTEIEHIPNPAAMKAEPVVEKIVVKKTAAKKPAAKRTPKATKGNEWSVK